MSVTLMLTGATTDTTAVCVVRAAAGDSVAIDYSVSPSVTSATRSATVTADADGFAKIALSGLSPGRRYYLRAVIGGVQDAANQASFRTHNHSPGQPTVGKFLLSSCAQNKSNHGVFSVMKTLHPDSLFFLHMGDQNYSNVASLNPADYHAAQEIGWSYGALRKTFFRNTSLLWMWDDHDFGAGDSDNTNIGKDVNAGVYRQAFPHPPLVLSSGGIYHTYDVGRVRLIVTDERYYRQKQTVPRPRTCLGDTQKAWFKEQVLAAKNDPTVMLTIWVSSQPPYKADLGPAADWASYSEERTELWDFFAEHQIGAGGEFIIVSGDYHCSAHQADYDYSTLGNAPAIPTFIASPLDQSPGGSGIPYDRFYSTRGSFGEVSFVDHGTHLSVRYASHAVVDGVDYTYWDVEWVVGTPPGQYGLIHNGQRIAGLVGDKRITMVTVLDDGIPDPQPPDVGEGEGGSVEPPPAVDDSIVLSLAPEIWLDAADLTTITTSSGLVTAWNDKSGKARHASNATPSLRPASGLTQWNGRNVLDFDGDYLNTANAATWSFLHDGSAVWTLIMVTQAGQTSNPASNLSILGTADLSTERGFRFAYNDVPTANDQVILQLLRGVNGTNAGTVAVNDAFTPAEPHLLMATINPATAVAADRIVAQVDDDPPLATNTTTTARSTLDATRTLRIGGAGNYFASLTGVIAEVIIVKRALTTEESDAVANYLSEKWGLGLTDRGQGGTSA